ncbi:hypothetical protein Ae201684P_004768 [Aphanomyces euteiches]|nr:hypothetical protein Ae201684P_004768 [Aphanomyces euteiches]
MDELLLQIEICGEILKNPGVEWTSRVNHMKQLEAAACAMSKISHYSPARIVQQLMPLVDAFQQALADSRPAVIKQTCSLVGTLAWTCGASFGPITEALLVPMLLMATKQKQTQVIAFAARQCLHSMSKASRYSLTLLERTFHRIEANLRMMCTSLLKTTCHFDGSFYEVSRIKTRPYKLRGAWLCVSSVSMESMAELVVSIPFDIFERVVAEYPDSLCATERRRLLFPEEPQVEEEEDGGEMSLLSAIPELEGEQEEDNLPEEEISGGDDDEDDMSHIMIMPKAYFRPSEWTEEPAWSDSSASSSPELENNDPNVEYIEPELSFDANGRNASEHEMTMDAWLDQAKSRSPGSTKSSETESRISVHDLPTDNNDDDKDDESQMNEHLIANSTEEPFEPDFIFETNEEVNLGSLETHNDAPIHTAHVVDDVKKNGHETVARPVQPMKHPMQSLSLPEEPKLIALQRILSRNTSLSDIEMPVAQDQDIRDPPSRRANLTHVAQANTRSNKLYEAPVPPTTPPPKFTHRSDRYTLDADLTKQKLPMTSLHSQVQAKPTQVELSTPLKPQPTVELTKSSPSVNVQKLESTLDSIILSMDKLSSKLTPEKLTLDRIPSIAPFVPRPSPRAIVAPPADSLPLPEPFVKPQEAPCPQPSPAPDSDRVMWDWTFAALWCISLIYAVAGITAAVNAHYSYSSPSVQFSRVHLDFQLQEAVQAASRQLSSTQTMLNAWTEDMMKVKARLEEATEEDDKPVESIGGL